MASFSKDATETYLRFIHENRRLEALQHVLAEKDKFGLEKSLFGLMPPQQQQDVREILTHILQLLKGFQTLVNRYKLSRAKPDQPEPEAMLSSALASQSLENAMPDLDRKVKWLQTTTGWTRKFRWMGRSQVRRRKIGLRYP